MQWITHWQELFWLAVNCHYQLDCVWNVMAHAQKPDFVFRRNGRAHLNRRGRQFSRLLAAEVCASAVVMLDTPCSEVVWRVLTTHSIRQFPLHFPFRASPCAITFQLDSTCKFFTPSHKPNFHHTLQILSIKATGNKGTTFQGAAPHRKAIRRVRQIRHLLWARSRGAQKSIKYAAAAPHTH